MIESLKHPKVEEQSLTSLKERMILPNISSSAEQPLQDEVEIVYEVLEVSECGFEDDEFESINTYYWSLN